jgi:superfamily I DNA and/or RNA helicase
MKKDSVLDRLNVIREIWPTLLEGEPQVDLMSEIVRLRDLATPNDDSSDELNRLQSIQRLVEDWKVIVGSGNEFEEHIAKRANVLGVTCVYAGKKSQRSQEYDWVIIDESGRATPPEILIPMVKGKRILLVGDDRQLPPFVDRELSPQVLRDAGMADVSRQDLETSLFQDLLENAERDNPEMVSTLRTQYRMHPYIARLVNEVFYSGELRDGVSTTDREHNIDWINSPVMWYSTSGLHDHAEFQRNSSYVNRAEVQVIVALLTRIEADLRKKGIKKSIGILSGYAAHTSELMSTIQPNDKTSWDALEVEVSTVDAIQGRECDFIIYSTVRSNSMREIGFLKDRRRINVALSRAKELLVVVGDAYMMGNSGDEHSNPFVQVLDHIESHQDECAIQLWDEESWTKN